MAAPTLDKPLVPGMKAPVTASQAVDGAVQLALTQLNPEGVKVLIEPPPGTAAGDSLVLRLNDVRVASKTIRTGEESQQATLFVSAKLWKDELNTLEYGLDRAGVELETSHALRLWFHRKRPGGVDLYPGNEGHSELALKIAQPIRDHGVNAERARDGVEVSVFYPLMRPFDTIRLDCHGEVLSHVVTQAEVDSGKAVVMIIDEATFLAAGDHADFSLSYTVFDCAGNSPDTNNPDSVPHYLYVNVTGDWYDPPIVSEDPNDAEDDPETLDLEKLAGKSATAQIYVARSWLKGDEIHLRCVFRSASGDEEVLNLIETIKNTPFMYPLAVPYAYLAAVTGGQAIFHYTRVSAGVALDRSESLIVNVVGSAASDLQPPTLIGAGEELDPLEFADGLTARVDYPDAREGDQARLVIDGVPGLGSPLFAPVTFNEKQQAGFLLEPQVLAANHGRTMKLSWVLMRSGDTRTSAIQDVIVRRIEPAAWQLPVPLIPQALGQMLDLGAFIGPGQVTCAPWPAMAVGQWRWFRVHGIDHNGLPHKITVAREAPVTAPELAAGLDNTLPRDLLLKFKPGSQIAVELQVSFGGIKDESQAVLFKTVEYQILNLPATLLEDFSVAIAQAVKEGGVMDTANLKFSFISGPGECAIMPRADIGEAFPGRVEGQVLSIGRDAYGLEPVIVELELKTACAQLSFWQVSVNFEDSDVEYFSADRTLLGRQTMGSSYGAPVSVLFAAPMIKFVRITCQTPDWFSIDNFRVAY